VKPRDRKSGIHHGLIAIGTVGNPCDDPAFPHQVSNSGRLFDKFEHTQILIPEQRLQKNRRMDRVLTREILHLVTARGA
jgi:hypothetical protein